MLSGRSILVSIALHSFLVLSGYLFINFQVSDSNTHQDDSGQPEKILVSRPVRVKKRPIKKPPVTPLEIPLDTKSKKLPGKESAKISPSQPVETAAKPKTSRPSISSPMPSKPRVEKATLAKPRPTGSGPSYPTAKTRVPGKPPPKKPKREETPKAGEVAAGPKGWGVVKSRESAGGGEGGASSNVTRGARPIPPFPEFKLTDRYPQLKTVTVKAKFVVHTDGSFDASLLTPTGNPDADVTITAKLYEFKWSPALHKGTPQESTKILDISLDV